MNVCVFFMFVLIICECMYLLYRNPPQLRIGVRGPLPFFFPVFFSHFFSFFHVFHFFIFLIFLFGFFFVFSFFSSFNCFSMFFIVFRFFFLRFFFSFFSPHPRGFTAPPPHLTPSLKHRFFLQKKKNEARFWVREKKKEERRRNKKERKKERADRNRSPSTIARTGQFCYSRAWKPLAPIFLLCEDAHFDLHSLCTRDVLCCCPESILSVFLVLTCDYMMTL